jgi:hypothetical protein
MHAPRAEQERDAVGGTCLLVLTNSTDQLDCCIPETHGAEGRSWTAAGSLQALQRALTERTVEALVGKGGLGLPVAYRCLPVVGR